MPKKLIIITGTPGAGKSTLAKALAKKLKFERLDLHYHYKSISSGYNAKKQSYDIDQKKFIALVRKKLSQTKTGLIVDSHISHILPASMVSLCIVLTCSDLKMLRQRLQKRGYNRKKVGENVQAEIFQVCLTEAREKRQKVTVFDVSKTPISQIISRITNTLRLK